MKNTATIIEFGTSKIVVLVGTKTAADRYDILAESTVPYAGYDETGEWIEPKLLEQTIAKAIKDAELQCGRRIRRVYVGVPAEMTGVDCKDVRISFSKTRKVNYGDIEYLFKTGEKYDAVAERYTVIHRSPIFFRLDDGRKIMEPAGFASSGLQGKVSYVFASNVFMEDITYILHEYGIAINDFISVPLAESLSLLSLQERDKTAVIADVGALSTSVCVVRGDGLLYHDFFPDGGENITKDLMARFNEKFSRIENLKKQLVFGYNMGDAEFYEINDSHTGLPAKLTYKAVQDVAEKRVDAIAMQILKSLDTKECVIPTSVPIHVTGGGLAHIRGCAEYLTNRLGRQVIICVPKMPRLNKPQYSGAVGVMDMALHDVTQKDNRMLSSFIGFFKN
ncbi:MAG: hypothetical protein KIG36_00900 [Eubacteriales bacterium]|nr:hypothetical protein [Eubacteriales bacterium]